MMKTSPTPVQHADEGTVVDVVSSYNGEDISYPAATIR